MTDSQEFAEILRKNGLKVTNQRLRILEVLAGCPDRHLTAEEIYDLVKAEFPEIGLATVYRTIQSLLDLHLIDRINLDDGCVRYEIGQDKDRDRHHHHHLICISCGKIISLEDDFLEQLEEHIRDSLGFTVTDHEVKLFGYCRDCTKEQNKVE